MRTYLLLQQSVLLREMIYIEIFRRRPIITVLIVLLCLVAALKDKRVCFGIESWLNEMPRHRYLPLTGSIVPSNSRGLHRRTLCEC